MIDSGVLIVPQIEEVIERPILSGFVIRNVRQMRIDGIVEYRYIRQRDNSRRFLGRNIFTRVYILEFSGGRHRCHNRVPPKRSVVRKHYCHHVSRPKTVACCRLNCRKLGSPLCLYNGDSCKCWTPGSVCGRAKTEPEHCVASEMVGILKITDLQTWSSAEAIQRCSISIQYRLIRVQIHGSSDVVRVQRMAWVSWSIRGNCHTALGISPGRRVGSALRIDCLLNSRGGRT